MLSILVSSALAATPLAKAYNNAGLSSALYLDGSLMIASMSGNLLAISLKATKHYRVVEYQKLRELSKIPGTSKEIHEHGISKCKEPKYSISCTGCRYRHSIRISGCETIGKSFFKTANALIPKFLEKRVDINIRFKCLAAKP